MSRKSRSYAATVNEISEQNGEVLCQFDLTDKERHILAFYSHNSAYNRNNSTSQQSDRTILVG